MGIGELLSVNEVAELANNVAEFGSSLMETGSLSEQFDPDKRIEPSNELGKLDGKKERFNPDKRIETGVAKYQNECIKQAEKTGLDKLDPQARGNYAEMKVDRDMSNKGYERLSIDCVRDLKTPTGPGIDGVYRNSKTGEIKIVETKFNKSELGDTTDGKQMSDNWIDKRLDAAVGKDMADEIRLNKLIDPDSVKSVLARVDLNGEIKYSELDSNANKKGDIKV